jgi:GntR family transcriptional regulator, transcriptional repressor for pyruvate dehydrogenase complex
MLKQQKEAAVPPARGEDFFRGSSGTPSANSFEVTVEKLGSAIKMGFYKPGERLPPERKLVEVLGVSRTTIREAIRVLTAQGILSVKRGRTGGTFVETAMAPRSVRELHSALKKKDTTLLEILDHRLVIESGVAELAAERATKVQKKRLQELLDEMPAAENTFADYRQLDIQFHLLIAESTGVARLHAVLTNIHIELADLMSVVPHSREACNHSTAQHRQIAGAIIAGKPAKAREAMREHVSATTSFLRGLLQS